MQVRWAAAILLPVFTALLGRALAQGSIRRERTLTALAADLMMLHVRMLEGLQPVQEALLASKNPVLEEVARGMENADAHGAWRAARRKLARRGQALDSLTEPDLAALERLFSRLGEAGRAQQEVVFCEAQAALDTLRAQAGQEGAQKRRLYGSLGLLSGLALAVCML